MTACQPASARRRVGCCRASGQQRI